MAAPNLHLGSLVLIVDFNRLQNDGTVQEIMNLDPLPEKLRAFGWRVRRIDGHSMPQILSALTWSRAGGDRPYAIVARTVEGKGVSFMENRVEWHGLAPTREQGDVSFTAQLTGPAVREGWMEVGDLVTLLASLKRAIQGTAAVLASLLRKRSRGRQPREV